MHVYLSLRRLSDFYPNIPADEYTVCLDCFLLRYQSWNDMNSETIPNPKEATRLNSLAMPKHELEPQIRISLNKY